MHRIEGQIECMTVCVPDRPKLYHITHGANLSAIVETGGLLADSKAASGRAPTRIGMSEVVARRKQLPVSSHPNTFVGDYVPFYFCPRSVMLYVIIAAQPSEPVKHPGTGADRASGGRPARGRGVGKQPVCALGLYSRERRRARCGFPLSAWRSGGSELGRGSGAAVEWRAEGAEAGGVSGASTHSLVADREDRRHERTRGGSGVPDCRRHRPRSCGSSPRVVLLDMEPER